MGKLTVKVHKCRLYRPAINGSCTINPRVTVIVDNTYRFQTHMRKDTFNPEYKESFFVGNTHRLAVIEVSVYDVQEPIGLVLPGIGVVTATRGVVRPQNCTMIEDSEPIMASGAGPVGTGVNGGSGGSSSSTTPPVLLGRCYIAIQRLVHNDRKRRTYCLGTPLGPLSCGSAVENSTTLTSAANVTGPSRVLPPQGAFGQHVGPSLLQQSLPAGITGTITISLESDSLGESPQYFRFSETVESPQVRRLRRFLLRYDKPKLQMLDLLMAHVRDPSEMVDKLSCSRSQPPTATATGSTGVAALRRRDSSRLSATPRQDSSDRGSMLSQHSDNQSLSPPLFSVRNELAASPSEGAGAASNGRAPNPGRVLELAPAHSISNAEIGGRDEDDSIVAFGSAFPPLASPNEHCTHHVCLGGRPELTVDLPDEYESFDELMDRLRAQYRVPEPGDYRVIMRVDGCTNIDKDRWNQSFLGSDDVFVVFRTEAEEFTTQQTTLQNTVVWTESNTVTLDVVNPRRFHVMVILMGRGSSKTYEIGRCCVSALPLSVGHISRRNMFLCVGEGVTRVAANGVVHLLARPINFGLTPVDMADAVDEFYERLSRFFKRYDQLRLPEVDVLAKSRLHEIEPFIQDLVILYGREPGTVRLLVAVQCLLSLRASADLDLHEQEVRLFITMGSSTVRTKSMEVRQFAPTKVKENYMFDVVRETDLIRIEVVNARREDVVYGRVDFSCLNTQRGVMNSRDLYLVGAAGTQDAYFSGVVRLNLYSDEVGHKYEVDVTTENTFAGRLRRYVHRRVPEILHRVNLAVATVFDRESFMAQMSLQYGDEDLTYALYFTVLGCRELPSRLGGVNPYVVVRVGIDAYQTKTAKSSVEPDYFEFCEFYYDRPGDLCVILVVMDQSDIGNDEEVGRAVIPLADVQPARQYSDWLPLLVEKKNGKAREVGTIGFKYTVVDLDLVDRNRLRQLKHHYHHHHGHGSTASVLMEGVPNSRGLSLTPSAAEMGRSSVGDAPSNAGTTNPSSPRLGGANNGNNSNGNSAMGQQWSSLKRFFQRNQFTSHTMRAMSSTTARSNSHDDSSSDDDNHTHIVIDQDTASYKSALPVDMQNPTMNLMSADIRSVEDFCSADDSLLNSAAVSETDGDLSASMDFAADDGGDGTDTANFSVEHDGDTPDVGPGSSRMQLRVRLLSCTNLCYPTKGRPCPYVLLSTICDSHRSRMQFDTCEPRFNETFKFNVVNPNVDFLSITVLTDTPYGSKKLGHCTLSMRNVQRGTMRTRWTSLVVHPFKGNATEYGAVYLSLGAVNFGMNYLPSVDAENRLREQIREYLNVHARQQLHRLEWYVGEFSQMESVMLGGWLHTSSGAEVATGGAGSRLAIEGHLGGANSAARATAADLEVTVYGVSHLYANGFLADGSLVVKLKVNGTTRGKTTTVSGSQGSFVFSNQTEPLRFTVDDPTTTLVKVCTVLNGKTAGGYCFVSLADLHRGVTKERTLMLVQDSRSSPPIAVGLIRVGVLCRKYGSLAPAPTEEDLALHSRLTRFAYYYLPSELAMVDVKYATTLNVAAYLNRMVERYGPEPGDYHLRVTVDRVQNLRQRSNGTKVHVFCIVRIGLQEFQSSIVEGESECVFCESFDLAVGLPSRDKVELILMRYFPAKKVETGRTVMTLDSLKKAEENTLELALVDRVGTKSASVCGLLKVSVCPADFGTESTHPQHSRADSSLEFGLEAYSRLAQTTYLFVPPKTTAAIGRDRHGGREGRTTFSEVASGADEQSDPDGTYRSPPLARTGGYDVNFGDKTAHAPAALKNGSSASVTIVGFAGLDLRDVEVFLRVTEGNQVLLRSKPIPADLLVSLNADMATFEIENVAANYEATYTLKLGVRKLIGADTLCYADFGITRCPANRTVEKRLRLYGLDGHFLGICRLSVTLPDVHLSMRQWRHLSAGVFEPLMDDVASLLATYTPKDLRRLDVILTRSPDIRAIHHSLRLQLAPSVVATVYLAIHHIHFDDVTVRHTCAVNASVGRFTCEAERRPSGASPLYPYGMSKEGVAKLHFPLLRIDISETGPAALLKLSVYDRVSKSKSTELGRTVVSLRALLTPAVFDMSEKVEVPLVSVRHASNRVQAALIGTITFSIMPPSFESYGAAVRFASSVVEDFNRDYVRYYVRRIFRLLSHYDANSLADIHARMYETYVSNRTWENGLPAYLSDMVARWGPEQDRYDPPPLLHRKAKPENTAANDGGPHSLHGSSVVSDRRRANKT